MFEEKVLYLIGGPNGSGKTTLAKELLNKYSMFVQLQELSEI